MVHLTGRPDFEQVTHIGADNIKALLTEPAQAKGILVFDRFAGDCTAAKVLAALKDPGVHVIFICGHGNYTTMTVQSFEVLWEVGAIDVDSIKDKYIVLLSCENGRDLGPAIVDAGAALFKGYDESFYIMTDGTEPSRNDVYARGFFEFATKRASWLLDEISEEDSDPAARDVCQKWIDFWSSRDPEVGKYLKYNMDHMVRITGGQPPPPPPPGGSFICRLLCALMAVFGCKPCQQ